MTILASQMQCEQQTKTGRRCRLAVDHKGMHRYPGVSQAWRTYEHKAVKWFNAHGFLVDHRSAASTVRGLVQLDDDSETFTGPFRTDVVIDGHIVQSFCGTVEARRVASEEIEPCP